MTSLPKKHILLVRSGYPSKQFVLEKLQELGYYVIVLDSEKTCPSEYVNDWIFADPLDPAKSVSAVKNYLNNPNNYIDGVITFWEEAVLTTAAISDTYNLIGIPYKSADVIKNKHQFRKLCVSSNLPTIKSHLLTSHQDFEHIEKTMSFPLVIKPLYGAASAFVMKIHSLEQLKKAYDSITNSIHTFWLAPEWESTDLYVEEYIEGQEVDIDILLQDGICVFASVTDNFQTQEPFFIESGQALPSALSKEKQDDLISMALNVLKTAGVKNGCIHFEAKSSPTGPVPIEVNLRMGGDHVYSFIKEGWGVCMIESAAKIACGELCDIKKPLEPLTYLEGKYFEPQKAGIIADISFPEELLKDSHLSKIQFDMKVGDKVLVPPEGFDFFGWITVHADSKQQAGEQLDKLFPLVQFTVT